VGNEGATRNEDETVTLMEESTVHVLTSMGIPQKKAEALTANVLHTFIINLYVLNDCQEKTLFMLIMHLIPVYDIMAQNCLILRL
jgi:hypothetical protein